MMCFYFYFLIFRYLSIYEYIQFEITLKFLFIQFFTICKYIYNIYFHKTNTMY